MADQIYRKIDFLVCQFQVSISWLLFRGLQFSVDPTILQLTARNHKRDYSSKNIDGKSIRRKRGDIFLLVTLLAGEIINSADVSAKRHHIF